ncbi:MAG: TolC family protein [Flavobacteriales bacterium]|nr:MAG: TolC family protein [Flavobacteriales bacterium]
MRTLLAFLFLLPSLIIPAQVLTAEEAVGIAVEQNHGVRLAHLDAKSAELLNSAENAGMLPTVDAVGQYSIDNSSTKQTFFSGETREADNADQRVLDAAVQLNWTVFNGLAMFATKDRLEALELIGQTQLKQQIEATTYNVLAAYYQLVQVRKAIGVQREGVRISSERLSITETGARIGSASGLNLVQARLDLSTDSALVLDLHVQEAVTASRLNALMGRDPSTPVEVAAEVPGTEPLDLAQIQQAARQANSTLQQTRQQQIAADLSVKELRGALLPQVDIFANYSYTKSTSAVGILQSNQALGPDYGARLSIPLFRGFQARSAMEVAKLSREQAALTTQQAELNLEESILNAWTTYTTANQRVALEEQNLTGARTQSDVALESYRIGSISAVELRDVQLGLVNAEQRLLVARYEAKLAELQLKWLAGRLV